MKYAIFLILFLIADTSFSAEFDDSDFDDFDNNNIYHDKYESFNRIVFKLNLISDKRIAGPIMRGYRNVTNNYQRKMINNFFRNLYSPADMFTSVMQLDTHGISIVTMRFVINSTIGLLGFFDVADQMGLVDPNKKISDIFAYYGVPEGSYLMLPFLGPSTTRNVTDYIGAAMLFSGYEKNLAYRPGENGIFSKQILRNNDYIAPIYFIDLRNSVDDIMIDIDKNSADYYLGIREYYLAYARFNTAKRLSAIRNVFNYNTFLQTHHSSNHITKSDFNDVLDIAGRDDKSLI